MNNRDNKSTLVNKPSRINSFLSKIRTDKNNVNEPARITKWETKTTQRKSLLVMCYMIVCSIFLMSTGCADRDRLSIEHYFQNIDDSGYDNAIARFGSTHISSENYNYQEFTGKVVDFKILKTENEATKIELLKKALLRRKIIQKAIEEKVFQTDDAMQFIWPRLEKILEDYYFYSRFSYRELEKQKKALYSGKSATAEFYRKNKAFFKKSKMTEAEVERAINAKIENLVMQEFNQKKLAYIQELLEENKFEILEGIKE